jgi:hypothetical protein
MMTIDRRDEYHPLYAALSTRPFGLPGEIMAAIQSFAEVSRTIIEAFIEMTVHFFPGADQARIGALVRAYLANGRFWSPGDARD